MELLVQQSQMWFRPSGRTNNLTPHCTHKVQMPYVKNKKARPSRFCVHTHDSRVCVHSFGDLPTRTTHLPYWEVKLVSRLEKIFPWFVLLQFRVLTLDPPFYEENQNDVQKISI